MTRPESRTERLDRCLNAVQENPQSAVAHYNLGLAYQKTGRFGLAEEAYVQAVEIDPGLTQAWVNLGGVRLHNWDFEGCLEASKMAVSQRDDLAMAHYNLGQAFLYMNEPENLVACNKRVIELERDNAGAHYYAAVGLLAVGDVTGAERHAGRAMELGHRPTPEFLRALERAQRAGAEGKLSVVEIAGEKTPEKPKED
jgi:tetratricopeptide (TPR) repeat protein